MPTCSFCKKTYHAPRGLTLFQFDGKSVYFCSSKCRRNTALKRDPKKTNWVKRPIKEKIVKVEEKKSEKVMTHSDVPPDTRTSEEVPSEEGKKVEEKKEEKKA